ncbi:MAG: hypothetical protein KBB94_01285 [Legionellaceae bacterium]|nr:hypothetical protein [Legionellaceae bacterium]MBP9774663.1 hypothetical protein [Legionellaceae bacterium]
MSKKQLVQYIYDNLVREFSRIADNKQEHLQFISNFIDAFLSMYPSHSTEITPEKTHGYQYREIALFAIAEFDSFYKKSSARALDTFDIAQSISRFLFARHASLVGLRSRVSHQPQTQLYPVQFLDTKSFTLNEHKSLLQKLTFCHVTSLSLVFPATPGKEVMKVYISSIHTKEASQQLIRTLQKIEFLGLSCDKDNVFLVEQLIKNAEMLPKLRRTIRLPEWDKLSSSATTFQYIAPYHSLQNSIRDNQKTWAISRSKGPLKTILSFSELLTVMQLNRVPEVFMGDHRQFALMAPTNVDAWPCLDHYLATRSSEPPSQSTHDAEAMNFSDCLRLLKTWAITHGMAQKCAEELFANASRFTLENAKALGQLFNSMDSQQSGPVGSLRWIETVNAIWEEFGQEHFFAWKACMLDKSHHWLDCVEANASIPISSPATPPSARKLTPTHFQISWLQLISTYSQQPQVINTHPELLRFVQTMLSPAQRLKMFGQNNRDLKAFFEKLRSASPLWLNFFQDPRLSPTAGLVPCAAWVCLLSDNKNGLQSLKWLPHFLILFQDISEADLFYFGLKTLYDCIKANAFDDQIIAALNASHDAVIAYQWFIQGRDPSIWLPVLYQEETQWSAEYFETLHYDQYREAPECIVKSTLYAADLPEVKWMLSLGIIIARSSKSQNSQFLSWATSVIQTKNHDKKINFIRALFQNQTGLGFYLDHSSLQHLWQLWCKNQLAQIDQLRYLAQITLDIQELKNQHDFQTYINDRSQRQPMLHALSQGFLSLGENLRQQCYLWFRASLHQITQWVDWGKIQLGHRSGIYHQAYQILTTLIKELQIATSQSTQPTHAKLPKPLQAHYTKLFSAQEQCYAGFFWSCNRSRINQARDLFKQLKEVRAVSKQAYYAQILDIIVQQQITIFTADQSYYLYAPNQKGHSRLHDICTELFLTVCHDCLCDPDLSETEKAFIQPLLRKQINQHVILLSQQIAHTPLAQKLNQWHGKQDGLQELNMHLSSSLKNCIPPKLQYLVRSLETMMTLPDQKKVLQCQDNRRLCLAT